MNWVLHLRRPCIRVIFPSTGVIQSGSPTHSMKSVGESDLELCIFPPSGVHPSDVYIALLTLLCGHVVHWSELRAVAALRLLCEKRLKRRAGA